MDKISVAKKQIIDIHSMWLKVGDGIDDIKDAEYYEWQVKQVLLNYNISQNYDVDGFPFLHKELSKTNQDIDEDYFYDRYDLYLYKLANEKEDSFDLYKFYLKLFWPEFFDMDDEYILIFMEMGIDNSIDFKVNNLH